MIKAEIYFDGDYYCAKCLDIDEEKTIDEAVNNLKEAVSLHLEDEKLPETSILTIMEVKPLKVRTNITTNAEI